MKRNFANWGALLGCMATVAIGGSGAAAGNAWTTADLSKALAAPTRPEDDRARDADRKPGELLTFFGVEKGMTAVDLMAAGGYMTDVLATAVGPQGKVYAQNPPAFLKFGEGRYDKAMTTRLANNRLPNVVRVDADLPASGQIPAGSVDFAITALNLHDLFNGNPATGQKFMQDVFTILKPGAVFGVIDHVGVAGADNAKLHRMQTSDAIALAKQAGFVVEAESNLLANPSDDHTKGPFDPALRGKTDQFILKLRKPK